MCHLVLFSVFVLSFKVNGQFCIDDIDHVNSSKVVAYAKVSYLPVRNTIYPHTNVNRFPVPDHLVSWMVEYGDYLPNYYESPHLHGKSYADPQIVNVDFNPKWHSLDGNIDRRSFHGEYEICNKYPLNVAGRTGIVGRGLLGRWAVNHAADTVVTRWKRNIDGTIVKNTTSGKNIIQMVAIQRRDNFQWVIPGGMIDPGEKTTTTLKREFIEEALNGKQVREIERFLDEKCVEIYTGYVDDPRNTDNAWTETTACNFHDDDGDTLKLIEFEAGDDARNAKWIDLDRSVQVYGSHKDIAQKTAHRLNAHW